MSGATLSFSGWAQPADALAPIAPYALSVDYAAARSIDEVADMLPSREVSTVIGWSLGGLIARQLMQRGYLRAQRFISLAATFQFVKSDAMPHAMGRDTFEQFYTNYRDDTARTMGRFHALVAKGDIHAKHVLSKLQHHPNVQEVGIWLPWLDVLRDYSTHAHRYDALPPTLIIHGQHDAIVPVQQAERLAAHLPQSQLHILDESGHAPHLHDAQQVRTLIQGFTV